MTTQQVSFWLGMSNYLASHPITFIAKEQNKMITVDWNCPECEASNEDDYTQTARPLCGECGRDFEWGEVLEPDEIINLNIALEDIAEAN